MLRLDCVVAVVDTDNDAHGKYLHYLYSTLYMKRLPFGHLEFLHEKSGSLVLYQQTAIEELESIF